MVLLSEIMCVLRLVDHPVLNVLTVGTIEVHRLNIAYHTSYIIL